MYNMHKNACAPKKSAALTKGIYSFGFKLLLFAKKTKK